MVFLGISAVKTLESINEILIHFCFMIKKQTKRKKKKNKKFLKKCFFCCFQDVRLPKKRKKQKTVTNCKKMFRLFF